MYENKINQIRIERKINEVENQIVQTIELQHSPKWDIKTIAELKKEKRNNRNNLIVKLIDAYNNANGQGLKPTIKVFAHAAKIHPTTFSKKMNYYSKHGMLPIHKNIDKKPWNIIAAKVVEELIKKVQKILDINYSFAKVDVPMTMPVFKTFIEMEYLNEGKKISNFKFFIL